MWCWQSHSQSVSVQKTKSSASPGYSAIFKLGEISSWDQSEVYFLLSCVNNMPVHQSASSLIVPNEPHVNFSQADVCLTAPPNHEVDRVQQGPGFKSEEASVCIPVSVNSSWECDTLSVSIMLEKPYLWHRAEYPCGWLLTWLIQVSASICSTCVLGQGTESHLFPVIVMST